MTTSDLNVLQFNTAVAAVLAYASLSFSVISFLNTSATVRYQVVTLFGDRNYTVRTKIAPYYLCNNFVKPHFVLIIFSVVTVRDFAFPVGFDRFLTPNFG